MTDAQSRALENFLELFDKYLHEHESAVFVPTHSAELHQAVQDLQDQFKSNEG